ncbi:ATP-binding protein [Candidatus Dojkabacteria bacterium]|nr:ATP-binding protein [Candidatus Dojkabacteria bacterium]
MRITVLSGKGGVGKSMLASSLAILFSKKFNVIAVDCDVDAPNLALWLGIDNSKKGGAFKSYMISTVEKPIIDEDVCTKCGKCLDACNFGALSNGKRAVELIPYRCEGCGLCEIICPVDAIEMKKVENCTLSHYETEYDFPVVQGQIEPGEAESGEAVTEIRKYADTLCKKDAVIIQDGAAGIGCPVIASIVGSDYVVAVAESSMSSFSDLKRALEVVNQFKIPYGVVVNKYDLNKNISNEIMKFAGDRYLGGINYHKDVIKSIVDLKPAVEMGGNVRKELEDIFQNVLESTKGLF